MLSYLIVRQDKRPNNYIEYFCLLWILDCVMFGQQSCANTDVFVLCTVSEIFDYVISCVGCTWLTGVNRRTWY